MSQASDEERAKWGSENKATDYLFWHGWILTLKWNWWHHDWEKAIMNDDDYEAILFMVREWDYGGVCQHGS